MEINTKKKSYRYGSWVEMIVKSSSATIAEDVSRDECEECSNQLLDAAKDCFDIASDNNTNFLLFIINRYNLNREEKEELLEFLNKEL